MNIYTAIDLLDGRVVRLTKGDFAAVKDYGDGLDFANQWADAGGDALHIVDLNGAKQDGNNVALVREMIKVFPGNCQVGGGIRTLAEAEVYLTAGAKVIIGTMAVKEPDLLKSLISQWGDRIIVGVDARDGMVAVEGWLEDSPLEAVDFIQQLSTIGVKHVIYTDIKRDGLMKGPNLQMYREIIEAAPIKIIASGGISCLEDVKQLEAIGVSGVIIGKALYEGKLQMKEGRLC